MSDKEDLDNLIADLLSLNKYVPAGHNLFDYLQKNGESVSPKVYTQIINDIKKIIKKYESKAIKIFRLNNDRKILSHIIKLKTIITISIDPYNNKVIPLKELMSDKKKPALLNTFEHISKMIHSEQGVKDYDLLIRNNKNLPPSIIKEIVEYSHGKHNNDSRFRASDKNMENLMKKYPKYVENKLPVVRLNRPYIRFANWKVPLRELCSRQSEPSVPLRALLCFI